MNSNDQHSSPAQGILETGLPLFRVFAIGLLGAGCLHLAYAVPRLSFLLLGTFVSFAALSLACSRRKAFYPVLLIGLALYAPQLNFFWTIFGPPAIMLWLVLAFWLALFSVIAWRIRTRWGVTAWLIALPFFWTGLEYFRSELYYLRFSWINSAYALADLSSLPSLVGGGMYLTSFVLMSMVSLCLFMKWKGDTNVAFPIPSVAAAGVRNHSRPCCQWTSGVAYTRHIRRARPESRRHSSGVPAGQLRSASARQGTGEIPERRAVCAQRIHV